MLHQRLHVTAPDLAPSAISGPRGIREPANGNSRWGRLSRRMPRQAVAAAPNALVQATARARLIEGGLPTEPTVAQVLVVKYADHLPLYRQPAGRRLRRLPGAGLAGRRAARLLLVACPPPLPRTRGIAALYTIERDIRGRSADDRRQTRQEKSWPLVDDLEAWLRALARSDQPKDQTR